jgi:hypothetical protein
MMNETLLSKCVVNIPTRTFTLFSDDAQVKELVCDSVEQFERVLDVVRTSCNNDEVQYIY